jgi:amino acid transporter
VGYVAMARKLTATGGFYSFISHGLGRELGMATGICGVLAYSLFEVSLAGGFAYFANAKLNQYGWDVPWPVLALGMVLLISLLTYFDIELSVKVLGVALVSEIAILLIFDAVVFFQGGGPSGISLTPISPVEAFGGAAAGIGIFFAFWSWVGFEAIPIYAEESRNPRRIVPLGTYVSVVGLGILYTLTAWALISAYDIDTVVARAADASLPSPFFTAMASFGNQFLADVMSYLIITGSFACGMAFHNAASRYFYAMGRERVLPPILGKTHQTHRSPHVASIAQSSIAALLILIWAFSAGWDKPFENAYLRVYGLMAVQGVVWILAIQALCAAAIVVYFYRHHRDEVHWWRTLLAPAIAFVAQIVVIWLLFDNIEFLGAGLTYADQIWWISLLVFGAGIALAYYFKTRDRERYEVIGRMVDRGV